MKFTADVCIVGAGFAGSLLANILRRQGRQVVLLDRGRHPRFAIGESSTPLGNRLLRDLCQSWNLAEIAPLAKFGSWQRELPQLTGGLKRGFSYFHHPLDRSFTPTADHSTELLVAASSSNEHSDTHWLRADVDTYLYEQAIAAGAIARDQTRVEIRERSPLWRLACERHGEAFEVEAPFLIDGTGEAALLPNFLGLRDRSAEMHTNSRGVFAHFDNVTRWETCANAHGAVTADYPFPCDDAAQHQVFDFGWMWQLRFVNDVVSIGFALDAAEHPVPTDVTPADEFHQWLQRAPSVAEQMRHARVVAPAVGIVRSGRLQRWRSPAAGPDYALLAHSAGFVDPLHSSGIAHSLSAVARLAVALDPARSADARQQQLADYALSMDHELAFIDELVATCYATRRQFGLFAMATMLYFAAATSCERQPGGLSAGFLGAEWPLLRDAVRQSRQLLLAARQQVLSPNDLATVRRQLAGILAPVDVVGLFSPETPHMYAHTAAPEF